MASRRPIRLLLALLALAAGLAGLRLAAPRAETTAPALEIAVEGAIGPATARHVKDALKEAAARQAPAVILRLNTPGGLASSMREIIADILASPVPVIGYVAPSGAHAASAGTYILYATHVAAMAPGTNLGAATPVQIGGPMPGLPDGREEGGKGKDGKEEAERPPRRDDSAMKAMNDAVAFIRSLAELRGRNADWGEKAVREAASLSARAALELSVIDIVAHSAGELLERADGRRVEIAGTARTLATKGLAVEALEPSWAVRLLAVITDPNIAFILMLVGVYGLIFEFANPGAYAPGVIGALCLLVGLYALNLLPVDYAGLALVLLGIAFMAAEAVTPSFGVLGLGGLAGFVLGAIILFDMGAPGFRLSWGVIAAAAIASLALLLGLLGYVWRSHRRPVRTGRPAMVGALAEVLDWSVSSGHVRAFGERWQARGDVGLAAGEQVEVADVDGLTLTVRRRSSTRNEQGDAP